MKIRQIHKWNIPPKEAIKLQYELQKYIKIKRLEKEPEILAACDVAFREGKALGAVIVMDANALNVLQIIKKEKEINYPYVPGLLTFREAPVLIECFSDLKFNPDIFIFDGQGLAHPRKMGLATHMGILINKPSIGCAKSILFGSYKLPSPKKGSYSYLKGKEGEIIGALLRTRGSTKPICVSIGNKITLNESIEFILKVSPKYRIPEPIRIADKASKRLI